MGLEYWVLAPNWEYERAVRARTVIVGERILRGRQDSRNHIASCALIVITIKLTSTSALVKCTYIHYMAPPSLKGAWALRPCSVDLQTHMEEQAIYRRRTLPTKNLLLSLRTASWISIPSGKAFDTVDSQLPCFGRLTLSYGPEPTHFPIRFEGCFRPHGGGSAGRRFADVSQASGIPWCSQ